MRTPPSQLLLVYGLNTVASFAIVRAIARAPALASRPLLRFTSLNLFLLLDLCALLWFDCTTRPGTYWVVLLCVSSIFFPDGQSAALERAFGRSKFPLYILSVATVAALVNVYLPITTFLTSPGELGIHLGYLLSTSATRTMTLVYVAGALYAFAVSPRMKSLITLVAMTALLLLLFYSYVYPFGYPMMNGLTFEQIPITKAELAVRALVDVVTVVIASLATLALVMRLEARRIVVGILLINLSLGLSAAFSIERDKASLEVAEGAGSVSVSRPIQFSKHENNVLILFLDRFMGGFVEGILERRPELASGLEGFTWYPRTVAPGENSIAGVHALLGGYDYTPSEMNKRNQPIRELSAESYAILPYNFMRKGYVANLVNPRGLGFTMEGDCGFLKDLKDLNCTHIPSAVSKRMADRMKMPMEELSRAQYADLLVLLGVMRGAPYLVKAAVHEKGKWRPFIDHSAGTTFREWAELKSFSSLSTTESKKKNLSIVFNVLPHEPYFIGEDCMPLRSRLNVPPEEVARRGHASLFSLQHQVASECALLLVRDYLNWLKEAGVYDNTSIVIVSDHGIVGTIEDPSSRAKAGNTSGSFFVRSRSVLFVKPRNAKGPLRVSEEFVPNAQVPEVVCKEIGGCVNPYLGNRTIAAHGRDQPFLVDFVPWQFNLQEPTRFKINRQWELTNRDPYDEKGWREVDLKR